MAALLAQSTDARVKSVRRLGATRQSVSVGLLDGGVRFSHGGRNRIWWRMRRIVRRHGDKTHIFATYEYKVLIDNIHSSGIGDELGVA